MNSSVANMKPSKVESAVRLYLHLHIVTNINKELNTRRLKKAKHGRDIVASSGHNPGSRPRRRPSPIEKLPAELLLAIMVQIPDIESLANFAEASFRAANVFKVNQGHVLIGLLSRDLGDLLPIAVARLEASRAEWTPETSPQLTEPCAMYDKKLKAFCRHFLAGQATELPVPPHYFNVERAIELWAFHSTVLDTVQSLSLLVSTYLYGSSLHTPHYCDLKDLEKYRAGKVLYMNELISILLPVRYGSVQPGQRDDQWEYFWQYFAPWEFCQYTEMQLLFLRFWNRLVQVSLDLHNNSPMGIRLRQIHPSLRVSQGWDLGHIGEVLVFHAGLHVLRDTIPQFIQVGLKTDRPLQLLDAAASIADNPGILDLRRGRYVRPWQENWRHSIAAQYKHLWLDKMDAEDGSVVYSVDVDRLTKKYPDSDDAPLRCWLLDLLNFNGHGSVRNPAVRDRPYDFPLSTFWSEFHWDMERIERRPPMSSLESAAVAGVLTEDNEVIPRPRNLRPHTEDDEEALEEVDWW
ncbi:hypothetical protein F5Y13DRAFT_187119 [Hypoxylon sp. FL1857]|nr:hypothetical protein F5Y13DRAFT_187119 [Hypoxylon sp. FL1857]